MGRKGHGSYLRAVENETMSNAKGDVVEEFVAVEIKLVWQDNFQILL
jgi:hypothetical protein